MRLLRTAAVLLAFANWATAQEGGYACNGVVVGSGTRQPLNHVLVTITSAAARTQEAMFVTGIDGRFAFAGLGTGKYRLSAQKESFGTQEFGSSGEGLASAIVLGPGQNATGIVFEMHTPARLSGKVVDENGDPVRGQVHLLQKGVLLGRTGVRRVNQVQIRQNGDFIFDELRSGTYLIAVSGRPWFASGGILMSGPAEGQGRSETDAGIPVTYYGGTTPEAAAPIVLREGAEEKIHIMAHTEPPVHVIVDSGAVAEGEQATHPPRMGVSFAALGPGGVSIPIDAIATGAKAETIYSVVPGHYRITLRQFGKEGGGTVGSRIVDLRSDMRLDQAAAANIQISGHLMIEQNAERRGPLNLNLVSIAGGIGSMARVAEDGAFTFQDAPAGAGAYELRLLGNQDLRLKTIEASGATYQNGRIEIGEGAKVQFAITAGYGTSKVEGIALKDEKPYGGALVLLMAEDPKQVTPVYRDQSDADGSFSMAGVWPGKYKLLAIDRGNELAYLEPKAMQPYMRQAQLIEVRSQGVAALKVEVQTRMK